MLYNATQRDVHLTILAVGKMESVYIMNVCLYFCLSYPASKLPLFCVILNHVLSSVAYLAVQYLFFYVISQMTRFSEKVTEHKKCVLIFSTNVV